MQVIVNNGARSGSVEAIASKSHIHRLLICAALSKNETVISDVTFSKDILSTINCLNGYLADITCGIDSITVKPYKEPVCGKMLDLNESGSTYRFLVPIVCAKGVDASFSGSDRLAQRPLSPLYELLTEHDAILSDEGKFPLYCSGQLTPGKFTISGAVSSQFISGLIFALPILPGDSVIEITGKMESYPYIKMTIGAVKAFGIEVVDQNKFFYIKGNQKYVSPSKVRAEGDWSNAAFFIAMGAISTKGIEISNLNFSSSQGDMEMLNITRRMGAKVEQKAEKVFVCGGRLRGTDIDAAQIPDLVPVLATLACFAEGTTRIYNAERLRLKESDRIESVYSMLSDLGANIKKMDDGFIINGNGSLDGGCVDSFNDHRIVMAATVASCFSKSPVTVVGSDAVQKSYPGFFDDLNKLEVEKT